MLSTLYPSDSDAPLLYETEDTLHNTMRQLGGSTVFYNNSTITVPTLDVLTSLHEVNDFLNTALHHPLVAAAYPSRPAIIAKRGRRTKSTNVDYHFPATIKFPHGEDDWSFSKPVIIHELAHHLAFHNISPHIPAHGPQFRAINHHLVSILISPEAAHMLWTAYLQAGLLLDPPIGRAA